MKIVFASSEVTPFAKTGGLADVSASLPAAMAGLGHQVIIVMPMYRPILEKASEWKMVDGVLRIPVGKKSIEAKVYFSELRPNLSVYFLRQDKLYDRSQLYGTPKGDYPDNGERFIFLSRGILHLSELLEFQPDVLHCNDWQTALIPVCLKSVLQNKSIFHRTGSVFTIHNLAYQGLFPRETMAAAGLPDELFAVQGLEFYGQMNFMKGGILFADVITTVSEKYSLEIQTPEYGAGLDGVLRDRKEDVFGVLNGVDYTEWNPETDAHIAANFSIKNLSGKKACKSELLDIFGLKGTLETPLVGMVTRLAEQKGGDLVAEIADKLIELGFLLVVLGRGDKKFETLFSRLGKKYKGQVGVKIAFDNALAHKIEAGADMFLMPSRYEPCGLNQMYSLKYGTIPVVRATGGLDDTVQEFDPITKEGNGFKFSDYFPRALLEECQKALDIHTNRAMWQRLMKNAMNEDFSWEKSALKYERVYRQAIAKKTASKV